METISNYEEFAQFFSESGLLQQADPAAFSIRLPIKKDALDGVMFVRWEANTSVVHFVQTLDFEIPEARLPPYALAVCLLNHALSIPGFGINAGLRQSYYRITMPLHPDGTITKQEVHGLFNHSVNTAAEHVEQLRAIATTDADPMTILSPPAPAAG